LLWPEPFLIFPLPLHSPSALVNLLLLPELFDLDQGPLRLLHKLVALALRLARHQNQMDAGTAQIFDLCKKTSNEHDHDERRNQIGG
jgi:hypothetical protein